jgi:hypothetical protein
MPLDKPHAQQITADKFGKPDMWLLVPSQRHKGSGKTVSVEVGIKADYYWAVRDTEI